MSEKTPPQYLPLWLTPEEHQALFSELLESTDPEKTGRLAELLRRADARAKESPAKVLSADGPGLLSAQSSAKTVMSFADERGLRGARSTMRVAMLGMLLIALLACLYSIFARP
jgi:hypothetical protein